MPKGSVGTSMTLVRLPKTKKKWKCGKGIKFCVRCRKDIKKGEWMTTTPMATFRHFYPCYPDSKSEIMVD